MTPNIKNSTQYDKTNSEGILQQKLCSRFLWGNVKVEDYCEDTATDGGIIWTWILNRTVGHGPDSLGSGQGKLAGSSEHGNELVGYITCEVMPGLLRTNQLLEKASAPYCLLIQFNKHYLALS